MIMILLTLLESCSSQGSGCADRQASNMDFLATENSGNSTYEPVFLAPTTSKDISDVISSTSGLIFWDGLLWTHNDSEDIRIYGFDTASAEIRREYLLQGVVNTDWEDIAEDGEYIYLGDFGNNASGNRSDLHILRIEMLSLLSGTPRIDTIWFSYSDQQDMSPSEPNQTEFDCEAMVVSSDKIFLFTKQWLSGYTTLYILPKDPGVQIAQKKAEYNIQGLVTGACILEQEQLVALCGYTGILQPFIYLLYDYPNYDFFEGNKRRVNITIPFLQAEGITTRDGLIYYLSNELFEYEPATNISQRLYQFDLSPLLGEYLYGSGI